MATELNDPHQDYVKAFTRYHDALADFVRGKQDAATRMGLIFAPRNRFEVMIRLGAIHMMGIPWVARLAVGRLRDRIPLPNP